MSVQSFWYWTFNAIQNRFQDYAPDYFEGVTNTTLLELSSIKAPDIALFAAENDTTCPYATA